jgi:GT2 family glycosyltransferase
MINVSIIIINYNTFQLTVNCIKSIITYTKQVSYEIILVDNHSSECNPEDFRLLFPEIKLVKSKENIGFSKGNNLGIDFSTGQVILLLNSDTELISDSISMCYQVLMLETNLGVLTCQLIFPNSVIQNNCQSFPSITNLLIEKFRINKILNKKYQSAKLQGFYWNYNLSGYPDWVWGTFFMFKKCTLNLLPNSKLDDGFFMYMEDMQWCWDMKAVGLKIKYISETKVIHHLTASSTKNEKLENIQKNYQIFLDKNYSKWRTFFINRLSN